MPMIVTSGVLRVQNTFGCVIVRRGASRIRVGCSLEQDLADVAYQLREARFAESLLNGVVRGVEDWTETSFHRAGHHASVMTLAPLRKNSVLSLNPLALLTDAFPHCLSSAPHT